MHRYLSIHYFRIIFFRAGAMLQSEASRTYLSFLWWIIEPILFMFVYYIVFGVLIQRRSIEFIPYLLVGLLVWGWFGNSVNHASVSISNSNRLINQLNIPKYIFPATLICIDSIKFFIVFLLLLFFLWMTGYPPTMSYLALPLLLITQGMLVCTVGLFLAVIVPLVPDFKYLIAQILLVGLFLSGVFFGAEDIPEEYLDMFFLNPMARLIHEYREVLLFSRWPNFIEILKIFIVSIVTLLFSNILLYKLDKYIPRILLER